MQIYLSNTTHILELENSVTGSLHWTVQYTDITISASSNPVEVQGVITTAFTANIIVPAPVDSTSRKILALNVFNNGITNTIKIKKDISGTEYIYLQVILQNGETLRIVNDKVSILLPNGVEKDYYTETVIDGTSRSLYKIGSAPEGAGIFYCFSKDTGQPGAWSPGNPGLNGRNCDGTTVADAGCTNVGNPASGNWYLQDMSISTSTIGKISIIDLLWVNSGLVVTTTTAQAITQPTLPARDALGTTNGVDVQCGILVTTATTNASAITNTTITYTNSDGVAGRTGTMASFPATAVAGTLIKFQLQAGDVGIRSVQSITLGTSYAAGAISLILFNQIISATSLLANAGSSSYNKKLNIRLFNGHCLLPIVMSNGTTAYTIDGELFFENK